jgi:hypothetical protein
MDARSSYRVGTTGGGGLDPRLAAARLHGPIEWQNEVSGFCRCPGEAMHTSGNGKKDCRVNVDGAPTIFCFHASCAAAVAEANRCLRRELGTSPWEVRLPGGELLRSGDVLRKAGEVQRRVVSNQSSVIGRQVRLVIETLRVNAERFRAELFEFFRWPMAQILEVFGCNPKMFTYSQPVRVPGTWKDGKLQRLIWLRT